jgi:hypothetical protein
MERAVRIIQGLLPSTLPPSNKIFLHRLFKLRPQRYWVNIQLPLQILAHLPLHLIDLA